MGGFSAGGGSGRPPQILTEKTPACTRIVFKPTKTVQDDRDDDAGSDEQELPFNQRESPCNLQFEQSLSISPAEGAEHVWGLFLGCCIGFNKRIEGPRRFLAIPLAEALPVQPSTLLIRPVGHLLLFEDEKWRNSTAQSSSGIRQNSQRSPNSHESGDGLC